MSALALAACADHGRADESRAAIPLDAGSLHNTEWVLVATGDSDAVHDDATLSLNIDDVTASGTGPCNRFHLPFAVDGNDVHAGAVASTAKVCEASIMAAEHRYFDALSRVDHAEKQAGRLVLTGSDNIRLIFARAESANRLAGSWDLASVATDDAVKSAIAGTKPTFAFHDDDTVSIATGCNTVSTTWHAEGSAISFGKPRTTTKVCPEPAGVMEQETHILSGLPRVARTDVAADHAILLDRAGTIVFILAGDP